MTDNWSIELCEVWNPKTFSTEVRSCDSINVTYFCQTVDTNVYQGMRVNAGLSLLFTCTMKW